MNRTDAPAPSLPNSLWAATAAPAVGTPPLAGDRVIS